MTISLAGSTAPTVHANRSRFTTLMLYMLVAGFAISTHAMWRDEIQAWLIARDSPDIVALYRNLHYEGHPALWYLLLMPLTRLTRDPAPMQILQFLIASATVAVVLWRAPLSALERMLFPFGFFTLYEYGVKSRSYALGFLFVVLFCVLWPRRRRSPVLMAAVLALMANVHVLLLILSGAGAVALVVDRLTFRSSADAEAPADLPSDLLAAVILCGGWALAILTAAPPADSILTVWTFGISVPRLLDGLGTLAGLFSPDFSIWIAALAVPILLNAFVHFRRNPPAAAFLAVSMIALLAFFTVTEIVNVWQRGFLFMAFFAGIWIDRLAPISADAPSRKPLVPATVFTAMLAAQAVYGFVAIWNDLHHPLSNGRAVARFIAARGWTKDPIVGVPDYTTATIVGYLRIDRAYYLNGHRWGSFVVWDRKRLAPVYVSDVLAETTQFGPATTFIASLDAKINVGLLHRYGYFEVARFAGASMGDENYAVYHRGPD